MTTFLRLWLLSWLIGAAACTASKPEGPGQATTVYLVRHGEKATDIDPKDPPLTPAGEQRALALRDTLQRLPIAAIYSTNTRRTQSTAAPLAAAGKLTVESYETGAPGLAALAERIRKQPRGKAVVVVGHSNTVLETIEALGAPRPVKSIGDDDFNYLFEVVLPASGAPATARARQYGEGPTR